MTFVRTRRLAGVAALALLAGGTLTACGSGSGGTAAGTSTGTSTPVAGPGQGGPGMDTTQLAAIQQCLKAAGISMPTPSGMPSGMPAPSGVPSGMASQVPDGTPPSGAPTGPPGGALFTDPTVVAALKACGITVPTRGPRGTPSATASATATG